MTHDYVRHGATSLFAALDVASGSVIAQQYRRHRHQEFLRFLKLIEPPSRMGWGVEQEPPAVRVDQDRG